MSLNTTPRTWVAGEVVTAAHMNTEVRDAVTGVQAAWDAYTPTLTGFTLGNGTLVARYLRIGKTIAGLRIGFTAGSTSTFSSTLQITMPVASAYAIHDTIGAAAFYDSSAGSASRTGGVGVANGTTDMFFLAERVAAGSSTVTNTFPWTWATSDRLTLSGTYEAA